MLRPRSVFFLLAVLVPPILIVFAIITYKRPTPPLFERAKPVVSDQIVGFSAQKAVLVRRLLPGLRHVAAVLEAYSQVPTGTTARLKLSTVSATARDRPGDLVLPAAVVSDNSPSVAVAYLLAQALTVEADEPTQIDWATVAASLQFFVTRESGDSAPPDLWIIEAASHWSWAQSMYVQIRDMPVPDKGPSQKPGGGSLHSFYSSLWAGYLHEMDLYQAVSARSSK